MLNASSKSIGPWGQDVIITFHTQLLRKLFYSYVSATKEFSFTKKVFGGFTLTGMYYSHISGSKEHQGMLINGRHIYWFCFLAYFTKICNCIQIIWPYEEFHFCSCLKWALLKQKMVPNRSFRKRCDCKHGRIWLMNWNNIVCRVTFIILQENGWSWKQ